MNNNLYSFSMYNIPVSLFFNIQNIHNAQNKTNNLNNP